jgi:antitoxin HicB
MWYELVLDMDDNDSFLVTTPAFPEVTTFGCDQPEALVNGRKAIEEAIASRISAGDDLPLPQKETSGKGQWVEVPALVFLKSAFYMICKEEGVSRAELARRLKWHREQVDRLFRLDHKSRLDQMELAFKAVGISLAFDIPLPAKSAA